MKRKKGKRTKLSIFLRQYWAVLIMGWIWFRLLKRSTKLYFLELFSGSSMILYNKVPRNSGKYMGTMDVYNHGNKGFEIKNAPGYIKYADAQKKSGFNENV